MIDFLERKDQEEYKPVQKVRVPKIEEEKVPLITEDITLISEEEKVEVVEAPPITE